MNQDNVLSAYMLEGDRSGLDGVYSKYFYA